MCVVEINTVCGLPWSLSLFFYTVYSVTDSSGEVGAILICLMFAHNDQNELSVGAWRNPLGESTCKSAPPTVSVVVVTYTQWLHITRFPHPCCGCCGMTV